MSTENAPPDMETLEALRKEAEKDLEKSAFWRWAKRVDEAARLFPRFCSAHQDGCPQSCYIAGFETVLRAVGPIPVSDPDPDYDDAHWVRVYLGARAGETVAEVCERTTEELAQAHRLLETLRERSIPLLSMYGIGRECVSRLSSDQIDAVFSILEGLVREPVIPGYEEGALLDEHAPNHHNALVAALQGRYRISEIEAVELIRTLDNAEDIRDVRLRS